MLFLATALIVLLPNGPGATANVDDPNGHGAVGDSLLSLDEAIRLANGTLSFASLSSAERLRVDNANSGPVQSIVIDAATTPVITVAVALTPLVGQGAAIGRVVLEGIANQGLKPLLASTAIAPTLSMRGHLTSVTGVRFGGGAVGIEAKMPALPMPMTEMARVTGCDFEGQVLAGMQVLASGTDATTLAVRDCRFGVMPVGISIQETTTNGRILCECEDVTFDGATIGVDAFEAGFGASSMCALWRCTFGNGQTLARSTRSPASSKLFMFRIVHTDATCLDDVVDCQGNAPGITMIHHHHGDWIAGPGKRALYTHPRTATFDVHGSEMVFVGDVEMHGNSSSPRFWQQNNEYRDGTITFDVDGALPNLIWNRYRDCDIRVPATARSRVDIRDSELLGTSVDSQSFLAPIELAGCWRSTSPITGFASESAAISARFLGTTDVSPREPQLGGSLRLDADLPFGIWMFWDLAVSDPRPFTSAEPLRFYGIPSTVVVLPVVVAYQSSLTIPLPATASLVGQEFYAQGIAISAAGAAPYAPGFHLPRGGRIVFR